MISDEFRATVNILCTMSSLSCDELLLRIQKRLSGDERLTDLERLNTQMTRLQVSLRSITQTRNDLISEIVSSGSFPSILDELPVEILQHIFRLCLKAYPTIYSSEAPILLTHICRKWRSIALDTPDLWSTLHIVIPEAGYSFDQLPSRCDRIQQGMQVFLDRSRSMPLTLSMFSQNIDRSQDDAVEISRAFELLVSHCTRWKSLVLRVPSQSQLAVFQMLNEKDLQLLESLLLWSPPDSDSEMPETFVECVAKAPRLHQLALSDTPIVHSFARMEANFRWSQLTYLEVRWGDTIPSVLRDCRNLKILRLTFPDGHYPIDNDIGSITLTQLERLVLHPIVPLHAFWCLDALCLPNLRDLSIVGCLHFLQSELYDHVDATTSLNNFVTRSSCPLEKFECVTYFVPPIPTLGMIIPVNSFLPFAERMVSLRELVLTEFFVVDDQFLKALTVVSPVFDVTFPNLSRIEFHDLYHFSEDSLLDLLSARLHPEGGLPPVPLEAVIHTIRPNLNSRISSFGKSVVVENRYSWLRRREVQNIERPLSQDMTASVSSSNIP